MSELENQPVYRDAKIASLIKEIRAAKSMAFRDSLFENLIEVLECTAPLPEHVSNGAVSTISRMAEFKTNTLVNRGYHKVGYILANEARTEYALSDSSVRWLSRPNYWRLMHEQDGSLFADCRPSEEVPQLEHVTDQSAGEVSFMPGTTGFTMACFKAENVPVGTKLYVGPVQSLDFVQALAIATGVFDQYKVDHPKWWKRMDGTPILNDVAVRMATSFCVACQNKERK